ncbi:creatininase family protein [Adhaeribacter aquaticus]|uniref:creatininase family protein n=1 Tax=Adhaeribacter aquaticus TaxID=299567 RepID=UPI0003FDB9C0|nr:creatininase family protein [Adhaeribacter aquaticus]
MSPRPYILAEANWKTIKEVKYEVAVLPWGATEAHNYHLPYCTDVIQCDFIASEAGRIAWETGAKVMIMPTIPFGVQTGQLDIPFCLNINPSTQLLILKDLVHSLLVQGIRKLVLLNGHGGNDFRQMIRELQGFFPDMFIAEINWFKVVTRANYFDAPGDHADEMETSAMLHIAPHLVLPLSEAGDGSTNKNKLKAIQEGWAWTPRQWTKATNDTGAGNPYKATAEKGAKHLGDTITKIASFLTDVAQTDTANLYEHN